MDVKDDSSKRNSIPNCQRQRKFEAILENIKNMSLNCLFWNTNAKEKLEIKKKNSL